MLRTSWRIDSRAIAGAAGLALGFALAAPAAAQSSTTPAAAAPETPAPPVLPYALHEVAIQASNESTRIEAFLARIAKQPEERTVAENLSRFEHQIQRGKLEALDALTQDYSRNEIEDLRARWQGIDDDLENPQRIFDAGILLAEGILAELRTADIRWQATLIDLADVAAPASVRDTAEKTLAAIHETRASVEKRRDELLARQAHVVALRSMVATVLRNVDAAETQMLQNSFQRNRAPLWRSLDSFDFAPVISMRQRFAQAGQAITSYLRHHVLGLSAQAVALLALFWLGWRARRAELRRRPDTPVAELPLALRHYFASALLLAIAVVPWAQSRAPLELTRLFVLAVLPAWWVLLRSFLPVSLHRTVSGLAAIVLFEILRELIGNSFAVARQFVLIIELSILTFGVFWLRRPARIEAAAPLLGAGGWLRALDLWLRIGCVLLPAGVIAATAGYVMIAEAVLRLYVGGSYMAGVLMLAAELAEELTRAWLEGGALDFLYMVRRNRERVLSVLQRGYRIAATVTWLTIQVRNQGALSIVSDLSSTALAWQVGYGSLQITAGGVVAFVFTLWIGLQVGRLVFFVLEQEVFPRLGLPRGVPFALATISQYTITTVTFLLALSTLGVALEKVSILMGALGVGIGFGLQNAVSNFISGLILLFERPIHVGDRLQLDEVTGVVTRIGMRASRLRTVEGADVIVPNSELISTRVTNWTLADRSRMVSVPIGIAYGSDLRRALQVLGEVASAQPDIVHQPAPEAIFIDFGESSVDFQVRVFADADSIVAVRTHLGIAIAEALAAAGIEIPFPQRDLHLRSVEESIALPRSADAAPRTDPEPASGA